MKRSNAFFVIGLILLIAGGATLVYGIITYNNVTASLGNALEKLFSGQSTSENQAVIQMIVGGAVALIGLVFLLSLGRHRPRRR